MHVRVDIRNDRLQLSDMLDFQGSEIPEVPILNFLRHFSYHSLFIQVSTIKILCLKLYCMLTTNTCTLPCASHVCYGQQIKFVCLTVHRTRNDKTGGVGFMRLPFNFPRGVGNF